MKSAHTTERVSRAGPNSRRRWRLPAVLVAVAAVVAALVIGAGTSEAMGGWGSRGRKGSHHRIHLNLASSRSHGWSSDRWSDPSTEDTSQADDGAQDAATDSATTADDPGGDGTTTDDATTDGPSDPGTVDPTTGPGDTTDNGSTGADTTAGAPTAPVSTSGGESGGDQTAMPGALPGWRQVFADDFSGNSLNTSIWEPYYGQPGGDPGGWWEPSHVVVHDGILDLQTYRDPRNGNRWVSGGVSSAPAIHLTYGKVLTRFRVDAGYGVSSIVLLYGHNRWPPEIDFAEHGGEETGRGYMATFLHYGEDNKQIPGVVNADFTQWHTIGVEWTPGKVVYTLDGNVFGTVEGDMVPAEPMNFDIQAQAGTCGSQWNPCPNATTPAQVNLQVDWATVYTMA